MSFSSAVGNVRRVLVVDDSRSIRSWMKLVLEQDPMLEVVGEAANADEARRMLKYVNADVMTLDVEMPGQSGLDFLRDVMAEMPLPVVMVSSLTTKGSDAAISALTRGAVDCIVKPSAGASPQEERLLRRRVLIAAGAAVQATTPTKAAPSPRPAARPAPHSRQQKAPILLGSSTGGVTALETILADLEATSAPVVIAQHMPENFLESFCERLGKNSARRFVMAKDNLLIEPGMGVMGSGRHGSTHLHPTPNGWVCKLGPAGRDTPYHPCVDDLFETGAASSPVPIAAAALLTGMGKDGAEGLLALRNAGVFTIAQDEATSTVFGMPRAAIERNAACEVLPLTRIGRRLVEIASKPARKLA